ncbi:MAG: hypothetical protein LAO79_04245 [Acidobacteriia bacterium]|nr:hypothetical protein [Terriglobia bacterium]
MRFTALIAILVAVTLSAGNIGRVYVYSRRDTPARSWLSISCDHAVAAEVKQGRFFAIDVPAGRHALFVERGVPVSFDVRPGEELFVRLDWNHAMDRAPIPVLLKIDAAAARREMRFLSYVESKKIHSDLVAKTDPSPAPEPRLRTRDQK